MLALQYIETHLKEIKQNLESRQLEMDILPFNSLLRQRKDLLKQIESLQQASNTNAQYLSSLAQEKRTWEAKTEHITRGKQLKQEISHIKHQLQDVEKELFALIWQLPNLAHPQAPLGKTDADNKEIEPLLSFPVWTFSPEDHLSLCEHHDLVDFSQASKGTGPKFYYLKNALVLLELALERYALDFLSQRKFLLLKTPDLARISTIEKLGFASKGPESNIYSLEEGNLGLIGTSEITLGAYLADQTLGALDEPLCLAGISHCFRKEAGAAGQEGKGLFRVHQFAKVEMLVACKPEHSDRWHQELLSLEKALYQSLQIPYRVMDICTGDLGAQASRKFDLEAWFPGRMGGSFGEITSVSHCSDYQARRLNIRYQDPQGKPQFVHLLNGTAVATTRAMMAILENHQQADKSIAIPSVLHPYLPFQKIG